MERYNFKEDTLLQSNLLMGEATAEEREALDVWRAEEVTNNEFWLNLLEMNELEKAAMVGLEVDSHKAWEKVAAAIAVAEEKEIAHKPRVISMQKRALAYVAVAASLVGAIFLVTTLLKPVPVNMIAVATSQNEVKELLLADGSEVTVNGGSKFIRPEAFAKDKRLVTLEGEAFFKVSKNKKQPFFVKTNGLEVRVVGTQFNVKDFGAASKLLQVTVVEGIVEVQATQEQHKKVTLTKGESVVLNTETHLFTKINNCDLNVVAWKTKNFVFNQTQLSEVFKTLSTVYKVEVNTKNQKLLNEELTANFKNRDIDFIVRTISSTFNVNYSINNGVVTFE